MNKEEIKIITLGDIFDNLETEEQAFKFLKYIKNQQQELERYKNIVEELEKQINALIEINGKYDNENTESLYSKKWLKEITDDLLKIIKGE